MSNEQLKKDVQERLDEKWTEYSDLINQMIQECNYSKPGKASSIGGEIKALTWVLEQLK